MPIKNPIDFNKLSSHEFEELCFELIYREGFTKIKWREGGADNGRDIEGELLITNGLMGSYVEKCFFECKKYKKGVPPEKLNSKIAWADAERPNHLVLFLSSYITNAGSEWLKKIQDQKDYRIHLIEGANLKKIVSQHNDLVQKCFVKDKYLVLLNQSIYNWVVHNMDSSTIVFNALFPDLNLERLTVQQNVFLYIMYYIDFSNNEELNGTKYGNPEIKKGLKKFESIFKKNNNCSDSVLKDEIYIDDVTGDGYLSDWFHYEEDERPPSFKYDSKRFDFISSVLFLHSRIHSEYKPKHTVGYYIFRRISKDEAIEICLYPSSDLEFKLRYIPNYEFHHYTEATKYLYFKYYGEAKYSFSKSSKENYEKLLEDSVNMR